MNYFEQKDTILLGTIFICIRLSSLKRELLWYIIVCISYLSGINHHQYVDQHRGKERKEKEEKRERGKEGRKEGKKGKENADSPQESYDMLVRRVGCRTGAQHPRPPLAKSMS